MKTERWANTVTGIVLALLGIGAIFAAQGIANMPGAQLSSHTLPAGLGYTLVAAAIVLVVTSYRSPSTLRTLDWPSRPGAERMGVTFLALVVYCALMEVVGFIIGGVLFTAFLIWYIGHYRPLLALAVALVTMIACYLVFIQFLTLSFPVSILGDYIGL